MSAYTVSQLAHNAGVSVHIVRDYLVRGLLRPVACTTGGYGVFDDAALQRLCFVRAAFEAGIGLDVPGAAVPGALSTQRTAHKPQRSLPCCASWSSGGARRWPGTRNWLHASRAGARGGIAVNAPDKLLPETRQPVSGYLWVRWPC